MARVLIGWELGANRGHIFTMRLIARQLLAEGHDVHFALQQIDSVGIDHDARIGLWQAPVWPRLLIGLSQRYATGSATMGDILARVGLDRPGALAAMIRAWEAILAAIKPDLVVAEFAPALLAAARGRFRSLMTGTGFSCPAATLASFPAIGGGKAVVDEADLIDIADADLRSTGRPPLENLPALFAADHEAIASFAVLDPYHGHRSEPHCAPIIDVPADARADGTGDELFVYFYHQAPADAPLWKGLADSGRKVRVHFTDPTPAHLAAFRRWGFAFERHPMTFDRISAQSRLALSHGGRGFVSSCLLTGLPQIVAWYDLEKKLAGQAVAGVGLGWDFNFHQHASAAVAQLVDHSWNDAQALRRCADARAAFVSAMDNRVENRIAALAAA